MKKLILFIFLLMPFVYAEEVSLAVGHEVVKYNVPIKLMQIGEYGSVTIESDGQQYLISRTKANIVKGLKIKVIDYSSSSQNKYAILDISLNDYCNLDEDCNLDLSPCRKGVCEEKTCTYTSTKGCPFENECKEVGFTTTINNLLMYCGDDWEQKKSTNLPCTQNYECLSNICQNKCKEKEGGWKMAPAWILIVIGSLIFLKGLLCILYPKLVKRILFNLTKNFSNNTWRIIGIIAMVIAILLVVWALT